MARTAWAFGSRLAAEVMAAEERSQQLVTRAFAALSARGARRTRLAVYTLVPIAASVALWRREVVPTLLAAALLLASGYAGNRRATSPVPLVILLHLACALVSWELREAGPTRFLFFIATALSAAYCDSRVVWTGAGLGLVLQTVGAPVAAGPAGGPVTYVLFMAGALVFTAVSAEWAGTMRRGVIRNARRRWVLEERQEEATSQLGRAHQTERRLVDMATNLRETQEVLRRDMEKRKEMSDQLAAAMMRAEEANRAKSAFLARMSHELRTPLNSVIGFSGLLMRTARDRLQERELEFLERIKSNGAHLLTLINDILDLSKIEAGRMKVEVTPVELCALVRECVAMLEPQARPGVQLLMDLTPEEHVIDADAARLRQVVINLVGNALKFTGNGSVTVALRLSDLGVPEALQVSDTGIGIPEHRQRAIFEPFEQADNSTARSHGGTGLGLAICRQLCALMGMDLTLVSHPGRGSTFTVGFAPPRPSALEPAAITGRRRARGSQGSQVTTEAAARGLTP